MCTDTNLNFITKTKFLTQISTLLVLLVHLPLVSISQTIHKAYGRCYLSAKHHGNIPQTYFFVVEKSWSYLFLLQWLQWRRWLPRMVDGPIQESPEVPWWFRIKTSAGISQSKGWTKNPRERKFPAILRLWWLFDAPHQRSDQIQLYAWISRGMWIMY